MLKKLLKYDMKALTKSLVPAYLILVVLALLTKATTELSLSFAFLKSITPFIIIAFVLGMIGIGFYTFIVIVLRFYKNIVKEEGYLTNTLPVKKNTIVLSKLISANIFYLFTILVMALAFVIAAYDPDIIKLITEGYKELVTALDFTVTEVNFYIIFMIILTNVNNIVMVFLAIALGQTRNDKKVMYSVIYWIVIYMILQMIAGILVFSLTFFNEALRTMTNDTVPTRELLIALLMPSTLLSIIEPIIMHIITIKTLDKSLNVE